MRALGRTALAAALLLVLAAVGCFLVAIWTVGPNSSRIGGTGAVLLVCAIVSAFSGAIAYASDDWR